MTETIVAAPRPVAPQPRAVPALSLLEESERAWTADVLAALRQAPAPGERHRRTLVLKALAAYERLRMEQAPTSDELTVFRRWPACTVIAISDLAAAGREALRRGLIEADSAVPEARWVNGWSTCWSELVGENGADFPGVRVLRAASIPADQVSVPRLTLDPQHGALIVTLPAPAAGATVTAGGRPCVPQGDGWLIPRPTPVVTCEDARGEIHRLRVVDVAVTASTSSLRALIVSVSHGTRPFGRTSSRRCPTLTWPNGCAMRSKRGGLPRFKDVISRAPEEFTRWHVFSDERHRGRARACSPTRPTAWLPSPRVDLLPTTGTSPVTHHPSGRTP